MALGFTTSSAYGSLTVVPDKGMTRNAQQKTRVIKFGDGYEQRLAKGINPSRRTFSLNFENRSNTVTNNILNFLSSATGGNNGAKSFNWSPPLGATGKWICQDPSVEIVAHDLNNIDLVFKEVFEP